MINTCTHPHRSSWAQIQKSRDPGLPQRKPPRHHNLVPRIIGYPNTKPIVTSNEEASRRRSTYSRTLFRTTKEEKEVLFSLFGLRKGKRHFFLENEKDPLVNLQ